jgi:flavin-dependent dehydrogenase
MPERACDVVIAGGGPAGSTTALRLARAGFHVVVLDAARFPRFKPCGEFMSPECLPLLRELGALEAVRELGAREVRGMLLHFEGRRVGGRFVDVGRAVAPFDHGLAVRRERFDDVLRRAAIRVGAEFVEEARVGGLLRDQDGRVSGVVVRRGRGADAERLEVRARCTLGADGVRSAVAGALGLRRPIPWLDKVAFTTRFEGVSWGDRAEVHLFDGGFVAAAPVDGDLVSVNLIVDRARVRAAPDRSVGGPLVDRHERSSRDEWFAARLAALPAIAARLQRGRRLDPIRGTGSFACTTRAATFPGGALVGDAAGYVDPITGEGIFFALKGGELLAEAVTSALHARADRSAEARAWHEYRAGRRREITSRAAFSLLLQRGLRHPSIVRAAWRLMAARPALADLLVSVTGDYVPLRELRSPRIWWRALERSGAA